MHMRAHIHAHVAVAASNALGKKMGEVAAWENAPLGEKHAARSALPSAAHPCSLGTSVSEVTAMKTPVCCQILMYQRVQRPIGQELAVGPEGKNS